MFAPKAALIVLDIIAIIVVGLVINGYSSTLTEVRDSTEIISTSRPFGIFLSIISIPLYHLVIVFGNRVGTTLAHGLFFLVVGTTIISGFMIDYAVDSYIAKSEYKECANLKNRINISTFNYYSLSGDCIKPH